MVTKRETVAEGSLLAGGDAVRDRLFFFIAIARPSAARVGGGTRRFRQLRSQPAAVADRLVSGRLGDLLRRLHDRERYDGADRDRGREGRWLGNPGRRGPDG